MILRSPAKINLFLKVLGKRLDGYHELFSAVQTIDLFDEISIAFSKEDRFTCDHPELQKPEENLAFKTMQLFKKKSGIDHSFHLHLKKNIPFPAGLGGGSSNVATVLYGLNTILDKPFSEKELQDFSLELSSDAPLFFVGGTLLMEGRGERVQKISLSFENKKLFLIVPKERLSTALVYKETKNYFPMSEEQKSQFIQKFQRDPFFCNDLQPAAYHLCPNLALLAKKLPGKSWMSGSGSAHVSLEDIPDLEMEVLPAQSISRLSFGWY